MTYNTLHDCILDLEKAGHLIRISEEVDSNLEMAAIQLKMFEKGGPAILFENIKGCNYKAVSNLFGTIERSEFIFRRNFSTVQKLIELRNNPMEALKNPIKNFKIGLAALNALPKKVKFNSTQFDEIKISDLPLIKHWPKDGGAFITLPQVYTEDIDKPGVMHSNLGMYRIQLTGNDYKLNEEIGLHYQLHRGIGVHQNKTNKKNVPLKVSIFIGGPPANTLAAVMPLPENISELTFAGALNRKRFRYAYKDGFCISMDADFVITGLVYPNENKPEGPFGDHLGYYSLKHDFPLMKIHKVYAKKNAIWPFTVVGRPPQEDTAFGALIHKLSGNAISSEIPGVKEVHAVDEAGVHPLLLAVGSERYTPYLKTKQPAEIITQALRILGTGQLSLAKYLFIAAGEEELSCVNSEQFFEYVFERINFERDFHFITKTTIDTLDYSGEKLNEGSKLIIAAFGEKIRDLQNEVPKFISEISQIKSSTILMKGVLSLQISPFSNYENAKKEISELRVLLEKNSENLKGFAQIILHDEFNFNQKNLFKDYVWLTYTRSNPSQDCYGLFEEIKNKHWSCKGAMIIDARKKPHHAPELKMDETVLKKAERFFEAGKSLSKWK